MNFTNILESIPVVGYVFLGLFILASIVQIVLATLEKEIARRYEKAFLIPLLTVFVIVSIPTHPLVYAALITAWIGDILVAIPSKKAFACGAFFFLACHLLNTFEVLIVLCNMNVPTMVVVIVVLTYLVTYVVGFIFYFRKIAKSTLEGLGMSVYYSALYLLIPSFAYAIALVGQFVYLGIIGYVFFIISDTLIIIFKYVKEVRRKHVYIMSTYLVAQLLIALGYVFTYIALGL